MTDREHEVAFEPPGPGEWMLDTTHHGRRPLTTAIRRLYMDAFAAVGTMVERYGLPLETIEGRLVHGCTYYRPKPLGEGKRPRPAPPDPVLWAVARLHPAMRRANRRAARAWAERAWRADVDRWFERDRVPAIQRLRALQGQDPAALGDRELAEHIDRAAALLRAQAVAAFEDHGGDLVPVGDYLAHCQQWGIAPGDAADLLRGASPASAETAALLAPVAAAIEAAPVQPDSVGAVRALGPEVADAVDRWLELHGWRLITSDDLDAATLAEHPDLQLRALLAAAPEPPTGDAPDATSIRAQVPGDQRALFDELLEEARYGLRLRDDAVGIRWNWPAGLLRRALLEAGGRLAATGAITERQHVFDLDLDETTAFLRGGSPVDAELVAARHQHRDAVMSAGPPATLGEPEDPPPLHAFPAPLRRATAAVLAIMAGMEGDEGDDADAGVGIGTESYRGRACVVSSLEAALTELQPGDVLVTAFTGPSWNSVLPLLGGIVVEEGGAMCHAAIIARELGMPAVVGVRGVTSRIAHGATVEIDPSQGRVRVVDPQPEG